MADQKNLVFSSDEESNKSDHSFLSSDQETQSNKKDFKTSIYRMQDQINLFLQQNPGIEINFEDKKKEDLNSQFGVKDNAEQTGKYWESFSKKVLKTSLQNPNSFPSMDITIHHLNNFKQSIVQKDPMEYLKINTNEKEKKKKDNKQKNKKVFQQCQGQQEKQNLEVNDDEIQYFSYKKKMQQQAKVNLNVDEAMPVRGTRSKSNNSDQSDEFDNQDTMKINFEKQFKLNMARDENMFKNSKDYEKSKREKYQSEAGQILYQLYCQSDGDINVFRRLATRFLTHYNQKVTDEIKQIRQVSVQQKIVLNQEKELNFLLPNLEIQGNLQTDYQDEFEGSKLNPNTPEGELEFMIDKLSNPKFIQFWNLYNNN